MLQFCSLSTTAAIEICAQNQNLFVGLQHFGIFCAFRQQLLLTSAHQIGIFSRIYNSFFFGFTTLWIIILQIF